MLTTNIIDALQQNLYRDLLAFSPELLICLGIVIMLGLRILPRFRAHMSGVALFFTGTALLLTVLQWWDVKFSMGASKGTFSLNMLTFLPARERPFSGLVSLDHLTGFL